MITEYSCPLCSSKHTKLLYDMGNYKLISCNFCELTFSLPMISNFDYSDEKTHFRNAIYLVENLIREIIFKDEKTIKVLEIGCGDLTHCIYLKKRYGETISLYGFDLYYHQKVIEKAQINKITLIKSFDDIDEKFDVIYAFHVLEHVPDFNVFLDRLISYLRDDGFLVLDVPNPKRITKKIFKESWDFPPYYLTRWNKRTFEILAKMKGLEIREFYEESFNLRNLYILVVDCEDELRRLMSYIKKYFMKGKEKHNGSVTVNSSESHKRIKVGKKLLNFSIKFTSIFFSFSLFPLFFIFGKNRGLSLTVVFKKIGKDENSF